MLAIEIFDAYIDWLRQNAPLSFENLAPPAHPAELDALEDAIGHELPIEVRAILSRHNGQNRYMSAKGAHGVPVIPTLNFLSTAMIRGAWSFWTIYWDDPELDNYNDMAGVFPGVDGLIKPIYTSRGWIPLWSTPIDRQYVGLDLDPGPDGEAGQIINFGIDDETHFICASDFTELLQILLEEVRSGSWQPSMSWSGPWFGDPKKQFTNTLFERFNSRVNGR
ncbi:SMI1/KNR4 family protein [Nocardia sp. NPDC059764]|uniref:SMI1/KNR4 family protein n=1 Tax=Nocardia sp. NPDC059764 TaxID=3346939 RepID=UPI00364B3DE3